MDINSLEIKNIINYGITNMSHIDDFNVKNQELVLIFIILDVLLTQMMIL